VAKIVKDETDQSKFPSSMLIICCILFLEVLAGFAYINHRLNRMEAAGIQTLARYLVQNEREHGQHQAIEEEESPDEEEDEEEPLVVPRRQPRRIRPERVFVDTEDDEFYAPIR
jgi:hypothetical protein